MYSSRKYFLENYICSGNAFQLSTGALYAEKECGRQGRPAPSTSNNFDFETFGNRDQNTNNIFDNVLGQQQVRALTLALITALTALLLPSCRT